MQLVPSRPNSKSVPESIRGLLAAITQNDLREVVDGTEQQFRTNFEHEGGATLTDCASPLS
jgi:hypothetical protein